MAGETKFIYIFSSKSTANAQANELREVASNMSSRVDALAAIQHAGRQPDTDLQDLRKQLQFLKNELNSQVRNIVRNIRSLRP